MLTELDIRVRFPKSERNIDQLEKLTVKTNKGLVSVSSFLESKAVPETTTIKGWMEKGSIKFPLKKKKG